MVDLNAYRNSPAEKERVENLLQLVGSGGGRLLDIGTRDGFLARLLAERFEEVVALDLELPRLDIPRVRCVQGDVTSLQFQAGEFDVVLCAEVLEHVPSNLLPQACMELARVTRGHLVVGVPYRQDTRLGRTDCAECGRRNPPWGHVNTFDEASLRRLFPAEMAWRDQALIGSHRQVTNALSAFLMNLAGNPWGSYDQDEPCVHCGARLRRPAGDGLISRGLSFVAGGLTAGQQRFAKRRARWIHVRLDRQSS